MPELKFYTLSDIRRTQSRMLLLSSLSALIALLIKLLLTPPPLVTFTMFMSSALLSAVCLHRHLQLNEISTTTLQKFQRYLLDINDPALSAQVAQALAESRVITNQTFYRVKKHYLQLSEQRMRESLLTALKKE